LDKGKQLSNPTCEWSIKTMKSFEYDLIYLEEGLEVLVDYLLSDEMFWPLSVHPPDGEPDYPRLTLGGLLLSITRLTGQQKSDKQAAQLNKVKSVLQSIRSKWRVAWEKKAGHNFSARLRMWRDFIEEYQVNPPENADRYPYEVRLRVMLDLLQLETRGGVPSEMNLLTALDIYLKNILISDGFLWESELQNSFPPADYWYLYGYLPTSAKKT
jgi:hypothetical protein